MSGYTLGQPYGHGRTEQSTIQPGTAGAEPAPGAGEEYTFTLQRYDRWRLIGAAFALDTDNTAGNRAVQIRYLDGAGVFDAFDLSGFSQAPSTTVYYSGSLTGLFTSASAGPAFATFRLSGLWLEAGRQVTIGVAGLAAADQLRDVRLTFDRTIVRDDGTERIRIRELANEIAFAMAQGDRG